MPKIAAVIFDNALNSQNQDYLPNRFIIQKEVIENLVSGMLNTDEESLIGLIPLAQKEKNDILTPTREKNLLSTFSFHQDLWHNQDHAQALFQADRSIYISEISEKIIYIFLASPIKNSDEFFISLLSLASRGIILKIVCFGDAIEFGNCLISESGFENMTVLVVEKDEDFYTKAIDFFASGGNIFYDADLEEAIKRSMVEK